MINLIVGTVILVIVGGATVSIIRAKKKGVKCIGCEFGSSCHKQEEKAPTQGCGCTDCAGCNGGCGSNSVKVEKEKED